MGGDRPGGASRRPVTRRSATHAGRQRQITLLQRKAEAPGKRLGKTTGWIHRATLKAIGVQMVGGVNYEAITDQGVMVSSGEARENPRLIEADTVVLCAGQVPLRSLADDLAERGITTAHVIGGADVAAELDAKRAIDQGTSIWPRACNPGVSG